MYKKTFREYMSEKKEVDRWFVMRIAIIGAFAGSVITTLFMFLAYIV